MDRSDKLYFIVYVILIFVFFFGALSLFAIQLTDIISLIGGMK